MDLADFTYRIPDELIADQPPKVRGQARLLTLDRKTGEFQDRSYPDIVEMLDSGDVLVINDTRVIRARLITEKVATGVKRQACSGTRHNRYSYTRIRF